MPRRPSLDLNSSFLDLLCGALGGVALLVMIFAAMQTKQVERARRLPTRTMVMEVTAPTGILFGREVHASIAHPREGVVSLGENKPIPGSPFQVRWGDVNHTTIKAHVAAEPGDPLTVRVWLKSLSTPPSVDHARHLDGILPLLRGTVDVQVTVWWEGRESDQQTITLQRDRSFYGQCEVTFEDP